MPLVGNHDTDSAFTQFLDRELEKVSLFYEHQEQEILDEIAELEELVRQQDESNFTRTSNYPHLDEEDDEEEDEEGEEDNHSREASRSRRGPSVTFNTNTKGNIRVSQHLIIHSLHSTLLQDARDDIPLAIAIVFLLAKITQISKRVCRPSNSVVRCVAKTRVNLPGVGLGL